MPEPEWHYLWDLANPRKYAKTLIELYGDGATAAAADCVDAALADGRGDDFRLWEAVLSAVRDTHRLRSGGAYSLWAATNPWCMALSMLGHVGTGALFEALKRATLAEMKGKPDDRDFWLEVAVILRDWTGTA